MTATHPTLVPPPGAHPCAAAAQVDAWLESMLACYENELTWSGEPGLGRDRMGPPLPRRLGGAHGRVLGTGATGAPERRTEPRERVFH